MRVADTSALYALFARADAHHDDAREAVARREPIVVPGEIFSETLALIHYRQGFAAARDAGAFLRAIPHLRVRPSPERAIAEAWTTFEASKGRLSFPDAIVVAWCRKENAAAFTFDNALLQAVGSA